jgi:hypothetical protein
VIHASGTLPARPETEDLAWWLANGMEAGIDPVSGERLATLSIESAAPPVWVIETLHEGIPASARVDETQAWYRILARGNGHVGRGVAVVESIVTRPWRPAPTASAVIPGPCPGFDSSYSCERLAWRTLR